MNAKTIMRRVLAAGLCCLVWAVSAEAREITGKKGQDILERLRWSGWVAQGGNNDGRHIYVLYAQDCPRCERLAMQSKQIAKDVEIRWIYSCERDPEANFIVDGPAPDSMLAAAGGERKAPTKKQTEMTRYNGLHTSLIGQEYSRNYQYPLVFIPTRNGVDILQEFEAKKVLAQMSSLVADADPAKDPHELIENVVERMSKVNGNNFCNDNRKPVDMRLLPDSAAPVASTLEFDQCVTVEGELRQGKDTWIAVTAFQVRGKSVWPLFVKVR